MGKLRRRWSSFFSKAGFEKRRHHLPFKFLFLRAFVENILSGALPITVKKRIDVSDLPPEILFRKSPGYFYSPVVSGPTVGSERLLLSRDTVVCQSFGSRQLQLKNSIHTAGWDLIEHSGKATLLHLDSTNCHLLETYSLNQKMIGWNATHLAYRKLELWESPYPKEGVVLFGSYMDQWGHFSIDMAFRLIDNLNPSEDVNIFVQEGTPENAKRVIRLFNENCHIIEVPIGKSIRLERAIVPLPRTFCPVGWKPNLVPADNGWGWAYDSPAVRKLPKLPFNLVEVEESSSLIYLKRIQEHVKVSNEHELDTFLAEKGFEFVQAELYPIETLAQKLSDAKLVVATPGSHLTNLLFFKSPLTVVRVIHRLDPVSGISSALEAAGHKVFSLVSEWDDSAIGSPYQLKQSPIHVDLDRLESVIQDALASQFDGES